MKVIFITGNHTRHVYLVKKFSKFFKDFRWIVEKREININHEKLKRNKIYFKHINDFKKQENYFFKNCKKFLRKKRKNLVFVTRSKTNLINFNKIIFQKIEQYKPQVIFSYGCRKIDVSLIKKNGLRCFNIHGGLLPKYRGVNTNFWPHVNNESNLVGITMHDLSDKIDSGNIFFQESAQIEKKDTINSLSCKVIKNFCDRKIGKIYNFLLKKRFSKGVKFKTSYKVWKKKDFHPRFIKIATKNFEKFKIDKINKKKYKLINVS